MENQVLSIERMQHLKELGVDTSKASMCWIIDCNYANHLKIHDLFAYNTTDEKVIPTFTLQDILDLLPKSIVTNDFHRDMVRLVIDWGDKAIGYTYSYETMGELSYYEVFDFAYGDLIDAAYFLLCWCIENGHIEKSK